MSLPLFFPRKSLLLFWLALFLGFMPQAKVFAQGNFELISPGDIEYYRESALWVPDVRVRGDFSAQHRNLRGEVFTGSGSNMSRLDYLMKFDSIVHNDVSLRLSLTNAKRLVGDDRAGYRSYNSAEQYEGSNQSGQTQILIDEAYINYHHNPLASFKVGVQQLDLGDRVGLIYRGKELAITQKCLIGTWCYLIGASKRGEAGNDGFRFFQLDYPILLRGEEQTNYWGEKYYEHRLNFEIFRVWYDQYKAALANYGGTTYRPYFDQTAVFSPHQQRNEDGDPIFRDIHWDYWGFTLDWQYADFSLVSRYVQLNGESLYYVGEQQLDQTNTFLSKQKNWGFATELQTAWIIADRHRLRLGYFYGSGNEPEADAVASVPPYLRDSQETAFYEVNKGTYGKANIYFNGYEGLGQGHSVSNLTFFQLGYSYISNKDGWGWNGMVYSFSRTQPVFNQSGKKVSDIGVEINSNFVFPFTQGLSFHLDLGYFFPSEAYSPDDNVLAEVDKVDDFSTVDLALRYSF